MTVSGTTNFNPSLGECVLHAFNLIGVRPAALLQEHMQSARMAANLLLGEWDARGPALWMVTLQTVPLVAGTATYSIPSNNIVMLDTYIETVGAGGTAIDRLILPISRTEYSSYPNKAQQGFPSVYWQDRLISGNVTLWPVPDGNQTSLKYYQVGQIDDAGYTDGQNVNIPVYFYKAFVYGLAEQLADIWAPALSDKIAAKAERAYQIASTQNVEDADVMVSPQLAGYWRP